MTTANRIRAILVKDYKLDPDKVTLEARLEDLGIDSLGMAELIFDIEDEFRLKVPDEGVALSTFGDVVHYIDGLVAAQGEDAGSSATLAGSTQPAP